MLRGGIVEYSIVEYKIIDYSTVSTIIFFPAYTLIARRSGPGNPKGVKGEVCISGSHTASKRKGGKRAFMMRCNMQ